MKNIQFVFIVATSRSGTTMMSRILNLHKEIYSTNELHYFNDIINVNEINKLFNLNSSRKIIAKLLSRIKKNLWNNDDINIYLEEADELLKNSNLKNFKGSDLLNIVLLNLAKNKNVTIVVEQTPKNILYINQLIETYPNSKFIHMIRDPRAVIYSQKNRWHQRKLISKSIPIYQTFRVFFNYHPYTMTKLWNQSSDVGLKFNNHKRYLKVKFENLANDPENETKKICAFLEINFNQNMLNINQIGSSNLANDSTKIGINKNVNEQWKLNLSDSEIWFIEKFGKKNMQIEKYEFTNTKFNFKVILYYLYYPIHVIAALLINPKIVFITLRAMISKNS
jgi:omega-hydroxy-beta-dihydromenaquinone-9 sulfotransferase